MQVETDGAHHGVDAVAIAALEEVPHQMAVGFSMADDASLPAAVDFATSHEHWRNAVQHFPAAVVLPDQDAEAGAEVDNSVIPTIAI